MADFDDPSYDPRSWLAPVEPGRPTEPGRWHGPQPLASARAVPFWLAAMLLVGITALAAWTMRPAKANAGAPPEAPAATDRH